MTSSRKLEEILKRIESLPLPAQIDNLRVPQDLAILAIFEAAMDRLSAMKPPPWKPR